jgi:hypothetical protein
VLAFEFVNEVVDKAVVKVLATKMSISGSRLDLKDAVLNSQERDIKGTTTEIEDQDVAIRESVGILIHGIVNQTVITTGSTEYFCKK